jgi:transposase-like protein
MNSSDEKGDPPNEVPPNEAGLVAVVLKRRRYSVQQKMSLIRTVARLMQQEGMCRVETCRDVNINPSMHLRWMKQAQT